MLEKVAINTATGLPADDPRTVEPKLATGVTLTNGSADTNDTTTVIGGRLYAVTAVGGAFLFGFLTTAVAANIVYAVPDGTSALIYVPKANTTLHFQTDTADANCFLREVKQA